MPWRSSVCMSTNCAPWTACSWKLKPWYLRQDSMLKNVVCQFYGIVRHWVKKNMKRKYIYKTLTFRVHSRVTPSSTKKRFYSTSFLHSWLSQTILSLSLSYSPVYKVFHTAPVEFSQHSMLCYTFLTVALTRHFTYLNEMVEFCNYCISFHIRPRLNV